MEALALERLTAVAPCEVVLQANCISSPFSCKYFEFHTAIARLYSCVYFLERMQ